MNRTTVIALCLFCSAGLAGCDNGYDDIEAGDPVTQQPEPASKEPASAGFGERTGGGRPALGKARNTAENTLDKLKAHDRDIQREIDKQNEE